MKKIIAGIFTVLFMSTTGYCQESGQPLQLTIKSNKQMYEVGEKINISYELENISKDVVQINKNLVSGGNLIFEVESERTRIPLKGPMVLFAAAYWQQLGDSGIILFSAKEKIGGTYFVDLISFLGWKDIPHNMLEGSYKIKAYLQVYAKSEEKKLQQLLVQLASNIITIEVVGKESSKEDGQRCVADEECLHMDCASYNSPVKEGYRPYCVDRQCKCMCYGCE